MRPLTAVILAMLGIGSTTIAAQELKVDSVENDATGGGVQFTRPDGTPIYVNPNAVAYVRESLEGEAGNATIVFASGAKQAVLETVEQVISGINIRQPGEEKDGGS